MLRVAEPLSRPYDDHSLDSEYLQDNGGFQVDATAARGADVIAEGEMGLSAVERLHAPGLDREGVVEVSTERVAF
jgi:hypothetical protein